ncbi:hypothetical protein GQ53DRAFT_756135 [Thozetella sp. PMI_491]|nr:hypothetical protein GQ53DRAFT_756135 [Thozetella sp. PMI_491]
MPSYLRGTIIEHPSIKLVINFIRFPRQDQPQDHFVRPLRGFAPFLRVHPALVRAQHSLVHA